MVLFKTFYHANPGAERKWAWSSSYISRRIIQKFLNISAIDVNI